MDKDGQSEDFRRLHDLISSTDDIKGFLDGMTTYAAATLRRATGQRIECAVTLHRRRRGATIAGSSDHATCSTALNSYWATGHAWRRWIPGAPVLLDDVARDPRWPEYRQELAAGGCRSALGVPLQVGENAEAVLDFFAPQAGLFTADAIHDASVFAEKAARALRLTLRIAAADMRIEDLSTAMEQRTAIDMACGVIIAQNSCSRARAFEILRRTSTHRNENLHTIAEQILDRLTGPSGAPPRPEE